MKLRTMLDNFWMCDPALAWWRVVMVLIDYKFHNIKFNNQVVFRPTLFLCFF